MVAWVYQYNELPLKRDNQQSNIQQFPLLHTQQIYVHNHLASSY
ncbi:hypothetical protein CY0110_15837 [Crocosphaera chwakensis CCY0110]|uniref:Uncharacterized protein n=1 Tax=Crocosphaera chwakensis CCY0110 TaxID=391612 RepID=A3IHJ9_9CHRO|nr:hypothetical protein CY0110_15837 [Crocosphaera chwakensis CCY0110]